MFEKISLRGALLSTAAFLLLAFAGCTAPAAKTSAASTRSTSPAKTGYKAIPTKGDDSNLMLGNPSQAARDNDNLLLVREAHTMSYNASNGGPNWVSWHIGAGDLGSATRSNFMPDPLLPADLQVRPNDYRGSGYDRGHVCPSGDRTRDSALNQQTFVMSNMLPQAAELNQQVWKDLEDYERYLVRDRGEELYVIAGGSGSAERIGKGKINVPDVCWKIIVVLSQGNGDLKRINASTRIIAVAMPNRARQEIADSKWMEWITTVAQLEKTTGYDFLSALPDSVEKALEAQKDSGRAAKADFSPRSPSTLTRSSGAASQRIATRQARESERERRWQSAAIAAASAPRGPPARSDIESRNASAVNAGMRGASELPASTPQETVSQQSVPQQQITEQRVTEQAAVSDQVWVNTNSGIYHYPGTRWYGATKQGEYMSEQQALANGFRAARNGQ